MVRGGNIKKYICLKKKKKRLLPETRKSICFFLERYDLGRFFFFNDVSRHG